MTILGEASDQTLWAGPVQEIRSLHVENQGHVKTTILNGIRIGEILTQVKGALRHGEWLPWIEGNLPFGQSMVWYYMTAYEKRDEIKAKLSTGNNFTYKMLLEGNTEPSSNGHQQLHEPNFHSKWIRITSQGQGEFAHWIQRRPLNHWATEELFDFLANVEPFVAIRNAVADELKTRPDAPATYRQ